MRDFCANYTFKTLYAFRVQAPCSSVVSFSLVAFLFLASQTLFCADASAQVRRRVQFFSSKALQRANQSSGAESPSQELPLLGDGLWVEAVGDQLQLEPVREIGMTSQRRIGAFQFYKNAYGAQDPSTNLFWQRMDEDRELSTFAQKVFLFQGATELSRAVADSSFGEELRSIGRSFTRFKNAATLRVSRDESGKITSGRGARKESLLELSFSTTPQRLIEPRLRMGENLLLRWDALGGETLLEWNWGF